MSMIVSNCMKVDLSKTNFIALSSNEVASNDITLLLLRCACDSMVSKGDPSLAKD